MTVVERKEYHTGGTSALIMLLSEEMLGNFLADCE